MNERQLEMPNARMILKRSISPDRRIDSLSVEISCPIDKSAANEIKSQALQIIRHQSEIVDFFLKSQNGNNSEEDHIGMKNEDDQAVMAMMLHVGGMDSKWGRRLFINVKVNGHIAKLFGTKQQLGNSLTAAGYSALADNVDEGLELNLPCRVITKLSDDGRFVNIYRMLPADIAGSSARQNNEQSPTF